MDPTSGSLATALIRMSMSTGNGPAIEKLVQISESGLPRGLIFWIFQLPLEFSVSNQKVIENGNPSPRFEKSAKECLLFFMRRLASFWAANLTSSSYLDPFRGLVETTGRVQSKKGTFMESLIAVQLETVLSFSDSNSSINVMDTGRGLCSGKRVCVCVF